MQSKTENTKYYSHKHVLYLSATYYKHWAVYTVYKTFMVQYKIYYLEVNQCCFFVITCIIITI